MLNSSIVALDHGILGGIPVFVDTRVPAVALLDYLRGGESIDVFLDDFPTVTRSQVVALLLVISADRAP